MLFGRAFRWRPSQPCEVTDLIRTVELADGFVVALANGYDSGFATCWATGSRLLLDRFEAALKVTASGPLGARTQTAADTARKAYVAEACALVTLDDFGGSPGASLLVAAGDSAQLWLRWIGDGCAMLTRAGDVIARTTPHTLRELVGSQVTPDVDIPDVLTRVIAADSPDARIDDMIADVHPGDTLVVVSSSVVTAISPDEIARHAASATSPQAIADQLVVRAFSDRAPYAAAVVVRWS